LIVEKVDEAFDAVLVDEIVRQIQTEEALIVQPDGLPLLRI
jgi:hypothetical protein